MITAAGPIRGRDACFTAICVPNTASSGEVAYVLYLVIGLSEASAFAPP